MRLGVAGLALFVLGCGSPSEAADAGAVRDAGALREPIAAAVPSFGPCPGGWSPREIDGAFEVCDPPSGAPCGAGRERFVDAPECVPVGGGCPSDEWADPPAGSRVVYVRAGAAGGDGTAALPYGSIQAAIERAPPGGVILVGKGTYDERLDVYGGARVIGACAAETFLAPSSADASRYAIVAAERDSRVEGLTIRPAAGLGGIAVRGQLALDGLVIEGATDDAILVTEGGSLDARALVVRDVRVSTPLHGRGIAAQDGTVSVERAIFERCPGSGILASTGAVITARAIVVRDSGQEIDGGPQLIAQGGGVLAVSDSVLEDAIGSGLFAQVGGVLQVDQLVIRRMRGDPGPPATPAAGVLLRTDARLEARRMQIVDVDDLGAAFVEGATAQIEDAYIARVARTSFEAGFALTSRGDLSLRRAWITEADTVALLSRGPGHVVLEDVSVRACGTPSFFSEAILLSDLQADLRRVHLERNRGASLVAFGSQLALSIEDVRVLDTQSGHDGTRGRGIEVRDGTATLSRVHVERSREVGILALIGARLEMHDVRVSDTLERECAATSCPDEPGGSALVVVDASASLSRFELAAARLCGAMVSGASDLDLRDGEIRGALVGACVQSEGYDVARLTDDVLFRDNGVNVQSTTHTAPPPSDPLPDLEI